MTDRSSTAERRGLTDPAASARFWAKVQKQEGDGCWLWTGAKLWQGYGQFWCDGRTQRAHRISLAHAAGEPNDAGAIAMHSCDNPSCVNPAHLSWGTRHDNRDDMDAKGRMAGFAATNRGKSVCANGHELTGANVRQYRDERVCKQCARDRSRVFMRAKRAGEKAHG